MGFFKNLKRKISIKNINPATAVGSVLQPTIKKIVNTKKIGIKDAVSLSPLAVASKVAKKGTSNVNDVVFGKPSVNNPKKDLTSTESVVAPVGEKTLEPEKLPVDTKVETKPKNKTLVYAGVGVGALIIGYLGYKFIGKSKK